MMKLKTLVAASVAAMALGGVAQASTITVTAFDINDWNAATANAFAIEDFETTGPIYGAGELGGALTGTSVGTFDSIATGGDGTGNTCQVLGTPGCSNLSLSNTTTNGQGNIVPVDGVWSLNATDTSGISWAASRDGGGEFGKAIFALSDAADIGQNVLSVQTIADAVPTTFDLGSFSNGEETLFVIDFGTLGVNSALINIMTMTGDGEFAINDSMAIDGTALAPVPLPAAGWMLLAGLGGLAAMRRRQKS